MQYQILHIFYWTIKKIYIFQMNFNLSGLQRSILFDALYSPLGFGYGGSVYGRAYDNSESIGDHGIASSLGYAFLALIQIQKFQYTLLRFMILVVSGIKIAVSVEQIMLLPLQQVLAFYLIRH